LAKTPFPFSSGHVRTEGAFPGGEGPRDRRGVPRGAQDPGRSGPGGFSIDGPSCGRDGRRPWVSSECGGALGGSGEGAGGKTQAGPTGLGTGGGGGGGRVIRGGWLRFRRPNRAGGGDAFRFPAPGPVFAAWTNGAAYPPGTKGLPGRSHLRETPLTGGETPGQLGRGIYHVFPPETGNKIHPEVAPPICTFSCPFDHVKPGVSISFLPRRNPGGAFRDRQKSPRAPHMGPNHHRPGPAPAR